MAAHRCKDSVILNRKSTHLGKKFDAASMVFTPSELVDLESDFLCPILGEALYPFISDCSRANPDDSAEFSLA